MPFTLKKPHPTRPGVKVWHTWDPDGDGYEEVRKFLTREDAEAFAANFEDAEVVEICHEISQTDEDIAEGLRKSTDPGLPNGSLDGSSPGPLVSFTPLGKLG